MKSDIRKLNDFLKHLESEGYDLRYDVQLVGMSGVTHSLDILGQSANDRIFIMRGTPEQDASCQIIGIRAVCYDLGLRGAYVANEDLDQEAERLADYYGITVIWDKPP